MSNVVFQEKAFAMSSLEEQLRQMASENHQLQSQIQLLRQAEAINNEKSSSLQRYMSAKQCMIFM